MDPVNARRRRKGPGGRAGEKWRMNENPSEEEDDDEDGMEMRWMEEGTMPRPPVEESREASEREMWCGVEREREVDEGWGAGEEEEEEEGGVEVERVQGDKAPSGQDAKE